jgi:ribonuclease VapC
LILDSSAIVAILRRETEFRRLAEQVRDAESVAAGAPTLVETELVLVGRVGSQGRPLLREFVAREMVDVIPFDERHWTEAGRALLQFGRGRHPARLNLGDCMTYATARLAGEPLLALGDDFALTDLELA